MDGQTSGGASSRGSERLTRLPDTVFVKVPAGTRDAIERAANSEGMPSPDWMRRLIRRGLDASRKRRERNVMKVTAITALLFLAAGCGFVEPDAAVDVSGEWRGTRIYEAAADTTQPLADTVTLYLLETLGSFVHGRWRGERGDSIGSDFEAVVTGSISAFDMILEYHDPAGGLCRVAGTVDFLSLWTYEARRRCEANEWMEEATYWFVWVAP